MRLIDADPLEQKIDLLWNEARKSGASERKAAYWNCLWEIGEADEVIGWISVNDEMPEEKKWVLCHCRAGICEVLRWQNGQWYHDPQHAYLESFVLYWMPLPNPPMEGEEEQT